MLSRLQAAFSAKNRLTGSRGENKAAQYLKKHGYTVLERNWKAHPYEIDIICRDGKTGELVFAEVKTRTHSETSRAAEAFTSKKQQAILKAAKLYLSQSDQWDCPCRFDLICICGEEQNVEHFINVIVQ